MIGVASIMPFIAVLTNPILIETNNILNILFKFFTKFGVESSQDFLFILGILVFVLLVVSILIGTHFSELTQVYCFDKYTIQ